MFGADLFKGNSKLVAEPLGVIEIGFDGFDLAKTTADSILKPDQDIKDIMFQQDGTKPADHVRTGQEMILSCTFGKINTGLLIKMMSGITSNNFDPNDDSGTFGRKIYQSMREQEAKILKIAAVDENGVPSELPEDIMYFYEAIPIVTGDLINWGADTQRNLPVDFKIKFHTFAEGESTTKVGAFGYWGDPVVEDLPAAVWPDSSAPYALSGIVDSATQITMTMSKIVALVGGVTLIERIAVFVNGILKVITTAVIPANPDDNTLVLTYPAASFAAGDIVTFNLTAGSVQDIDLAQNAVISDFSVNNPLV